MTIGGVDTAAVVVDREWRPPFPLDLYGVLAPLRRGRGDPTWRTAVDGAANPRTHIIDTASTDAVRDLIRTLPPL